MKRSQQSVPATETGAISGDGGGSRSFMQMPTKGGRNATTNQGSHARGGNLAKVKGAGKGDPAGRLPVQHPTANIANQKVGQPNPNTAAAATKKPKTRAALAFYGEN